MTYLGIDGGGSKTVFLLADDRGRELARVHSGASNWLSVGRAAAAAAIRDGVARLAGPAPDFVCAGFAGAGRPEGLEFYRSVLEPLFPSSAVRVESDGLIAYVGAIGLSPGVLLIAGTGSIAIGRHADGAMIRAGGWGPHFGDESGGFWIGREAVRTALRSLDTSRSDEFSVKVSAALGLSSTEKVVAEWGAGRIGVPEIAALFPVVLTLYPEEPAASILHLAASHLRSVTETALRRIDSSPRALSVMGSVASHPVMRRLIGLDFTDPVAPAETGAILLAKSMSGGH